MTAPLKIGIIGAGFAGVAFAAACHRLNREPMDIYLFEKTGRFGAGDAYRTPYPFHLLNVRADDMSAIEDEPAHFVAWLQTHFSLAENNPWFDSAIPLSDQFMPRKVYSDYLWDLLQSMQRDAATNIKLHLKSQEVIDIILVQQQVCLVLKNNEKIWVDKVVLALGNHAGGFPFPIANTHCIANPWDYIAFEKIQQTDPVLIVGTGLSMIDSVLMLYEQRHQGKIYAISRHGLLPLPHVHHKTAPFSLDKNFPLALRKLTQFLRLQIKSHMATGGDWQAVINALRHHVPAIWTAISLADKQRFLRHLLPYWNIHRHRVHKKIVELLLQLMQKQQLVLLSGRVMSVENNCTRVRLRHTQKVLQFDTTWAVNCTGPSLDISAAEQPLLHALLQKGLAVLDYLNLGIRTESTGALQQANGEISSQLYVLGGLRKGSCWEVNAVPEIRKQCWELARNINII
ncbi:MAG: FAD/NAD(P)-binding protein [Gammaproteobacteria bacterium]|nr:FAD/NAD(P)-binding protein [Gammaproteobacteria bacterium]